jgi:hypothetical protein
LPAFGRVEGNNVIVFLHARHARPDIDDNAGALMAQNGREQPLGVGAGKRELVGVADAGGFDLDQNLPGLRPVEVDLRDLERLGLLQCNSSTGFMAVFLLVESVYTKSPALGPVGLWREPLLENMIAPERRSNNCVNKFGGHHGEDLNSSGGR